jgi:thioredoxin reductase/CRP-like cAMP-binding protein
MAYYEIAIIGGGAAGLSAAAQAAERKISHVLLERGTQLGGVMSRLLMTSLVPVPYDLPPRSDLDLDGRPPKALAEAWASWIEKGGTPILFNADVTSITGQKGDFRITVNEREVIGAEQVIFAIGHERDPIRTHVPGSDSPLVTYEDGGFSGENVIVLGNGDDAAAAAALQLHEYNNVTLVSEENEFRFVDDDKASKIAELVKQEQLFQFAGFKLTEISGKHAIFNLKDGTSVQIGFDHLIVRLGSRWRSEFLKSCGLNIGDGYEISETYESPVPGIFVIGAAARFPLVRNCLNQGYDVVEAISQKQVVPADEDIVMRSASKKVLEILGLENESISGWQLVRLVQQRLPFFKEYRNHEIRDALRQNDNIEIREPGDVVIRSGDQAYYTYWVLEGGVDVVYPPRPEPIQVTTGDFFGEGSYLEARHDIFATCTERTVLLKISRIEFSSKFFLPSEIIAARLLDQCFMYDVVDDDLSAIIHNNTELLQIFGEEMFIKENELNRNIYIIRSGIAEVLLKIAGHNIPVAYVTAGSVVGSMAALGHLKAVAPPISKTVKIVRDGVKVDLTDRTLPAPYSVRALRSLEVVRLDVSSLRTILRRSAELTASLARRHQQYVRTWEHNRLNHEEPALSALRGTGIGQAIDVLGPFRAGPDEEQARPGLRVLVMGLFHRDGTGRTEVTVEPAPRPGHVFVSYAGPDRKAAERIVKNLEATGLRCWVGYRDVTRRHQREIGRAIRAAAAMVVVFSARANSSIGMCKEVVLADKIKLHKIPARIADVEPTDEMEYALAGDQFIDLFDDYPKGIAKLVMTLRTVATPH